MADQYGSSLDEPREKNPVGPVAVEKKCHKASHSLLLFEANLVIST